jgi:DNA invertase Pin-like site-specific DNA recombinase
MTGERRLLRCAVYTRKSSEQGLEQDFNSLAAQCEAAESYVLSQRHEGWRLIKHRYDDGGYSGGTMERPALKRLLADIKGGRIDVVVVYKVDRLTRSLADFAKLVEIFDANRVSFVSVTQQFNTTTSMGRLTLNVLLSFAQFEREVTGERIRDKFLASRRKGMWMGGLPPLGYDVKDRKLVVNPSEAGTVRLMFRRYAELGSAAKLLEHLRERRIRTKRYRSAAGRSVGGRPFSRGHIYWILTNRVYLGEAVHKGKAYPGEHVGIVTRELWDRVQAVLAHNRREARSGARAKSSSLLRGLIWDDAGNRMSPSHACRHGVRYRYYVSQAILQHEPDKSGSVGRLPAGELEQVVANALVDRLPRNAANDTLRQRLRRLDAAARQRLVRRAVEKVEVSSTQVKIMLNPSRLDDSAAQAKPHASNKDRRIVITVPFEVIRRGGATRVLVDGKARTAQDSCPALVKAVARGYVWREQLLNGKARSIDEIAGRSGVTPSYVGRILPLGFLAPDIVESILAGKHPDTWSLAGLPSALPSDWDDQRRAIGAPSRG